MVQIPSGKMECNFPELSRAILMLKGMHHQLEDVQDDLNEYCKRFNRNFMTVGIFDKLMLRMVNTPPFYIKNLIPHVHAMVST